MADDYVDVENDTGNDQMHNTTDLLETRIRHTVEKNSTDAIDVNNFSNHGNNHCFSSENEQHHQNKPYIQGEKIHGQIQEDFNGSYEQQEDDDSADNDNQDRIGMVTTRGMKLVNRVPKGTQIKIATGIECTPEELVKLQGEDESLKFIRQKIVDDDETALEAGGAIYIKRNGIIFRKYKDKKEFRDKIITQVVVPVKLRMGVMKLAHETPIGAHQGFKKCLYRVMEQFFWSGLQNDLRRFINSCEICQRTVTKGSVQRVPMELTVLGEGVFDHIYVDLIGELVPNSSEGHKYIMTVIDSVSKYCEGVCLKHIDSVTIANELFKIFTRLGIPRKITVDNGINFNSEIIKEVYKLFGMTVINTTLYKACANMVERFNGTLKRMLKRLSAEKPRQWHKYLDACLFAYRDSVHSSTGVRPFELMFGRDVVGPMTLLKEIWTKPDMVPETRTSYQYVCDLKNKIQETCKYAQDELKKVQLKNKTLYDKKAKHRDIRPNDDVLILRPSSRNKMQLTFMGPYKVSRATGKYTFKVLVDGEEKSYHANLLKRYNHREESNEKVRMVTSVIEDEESDEGPGLIKLQDRKDLILVETKNLSSIHDIRFGEELTDKQVREAKNLVAQYQDIFSDIPKRTNLESLKITLRSDECVQSRPYPVPVHLKEKLDTEIDEMLKLGIISKVSYPSKFCSPIVTVKKPDGSLRICVNFKRVNNLLVPDPEPTNLADDIFNQIGGSRFYSKFDMARGYWQIPIEEESKDVTTFTCHRGLFRFNVLPFGIQSGSQVFCRAMRKLLAGAKGIDNYIDDVLAYSRTWEDHLMTLKSFFERVRRARRA